MKSYSQNKEDLKVLEYFDGRKGTLLSIGENDGTTFSNARLLIENGWKAHLIEPSSTYDEMETLHKENKKVFTYNIAIGDEDGRKTLYESGPHVENGIDRCLVSTFIEGEKKRWHKVNFTRKEVVVNTFDSFREQAGETCFNFISLDAEGMDMDILRQIDLGVVCCECLCIEWNGNKKLKNEIVGHCQFFGLKLIHQNSENLILAQ